VGAVRALLERSPERHRHIKRLGEHALKAEELLSAQHPQLNKLGELINDAHDDLAHLGVSTPQLERLRAELRARGALGAKLTGAGFGGAVFGLFEGAAEAEVAARELKGLSVCFKPTQLDSERSIL
jgi:mevalonate kinase